MYGRFSRNRINLAMLDVFLYTKSKEVFWVLKMVLSAIQTKNII